MITGVSHAIFFLQTTLEFLMCVNSFYFQMNSHPQEKKEYFAIIIKLNAEETNGERLLNLYKTVRYFLEIIDVCLIEYKNMCTFKSKICIKVIIGLETFKNRKNHA